MTGLVLGEVKNLWDIANNFGTNGETAVKALAGVGALWFVVHGTWKASSRLAGLIIHGVVAALFMFILSSVNWLGTVAGNTVKDQSGMGPVATQVYTPPGA